MAETNDLYLLDFPLGTDLTKKRVLAQLVEVGEQTMRFITSDTDEQIEDMQILGTEIPAHYNATRLGATEDYLKRHEEAFQALLVAADAIEHGQLTQARAVRAIAETGCTPEVALEVALAESLACVQMGERRRAAAAAVIANS